MHKRLMAMKENLASCIEYQLHNMGEVDTEELGEAIDMLKDLEEALYFCTITEAMNGEKGGSSEFGYKKNGYHQYDDSQYYGGGGNVQSFYGGDGSGRSYNDGGNGGQMSGGGNSSYYGGGSSSYYGGNGGNNGGSNSSYYSDSMYYQGRDSQGRFTSGSGSNNGSRSNYSEPSMYMRDEREGRSPQNRRMYMEAKGTKDKATQMRELEKYMNELTSDMVEMIQDASPEEKQYLEKKITMLGSKIGQMK